MDTTEQYIAGHGPIARYGATETEPAYYWCPILVATPEGPTVRIARVDESALYELLEQDVQQQLNP